MIHSENIRSPLRLILGVAGTIVILVGMYFAAWIVNLVLLALLITLITLPLKRRLLARGFKPRNAYLITLLAILMLSVLILAITIFSLANAAANVPAFSQQFQARSGALAGAAAAAGIDISALTQLSQDAANSILQAIVSIVENGISGLVFLAFVLLIVAFMLAEAERFGQLVARTVGADNPAYKNSTASLSTVVTYFIITARINLMIAIGDVVLLWLLGVPYAFLWGIVSFIFGFIPYIGYWVSILPPLVLAFATGGAVSALVVLLGYWLINGFLSQIVAPRLYGKGLDLSVTLTVIVVLFWGWLLGPIGGILAMPLTAVIKSALLASYPQTAWLATVLSDSSQESAPAAEKATADRASNSG